MGDEKKDIKTNIFFGYTVEKPDVLFFALSLLILYSTFGYISELKQIPSPQYGGDLYNGLGGVIHILDGGDILDSAQMEGGVPWVPWLYHLSVALFSIFSGLDAMDSLLNFSLVVELFSLLIVYLFLQNLFKNKYIGLLSIPLYFSIGFFPVFKYSYFSSVLVIPLFAMSLFLFLRDPSLKNMVFSGLSLGLVGLSNTQSFFVGFMIFGLSFLFFAFPKIYDIRKRILVFDKKDEQYLKLFLAIFVIGFLISLLFWYRPIFVHHGETPNDIQNITTPDIRSNSSLLWSSIYSLFKDLLFPYSSGFLLIFTLLGLLGIYHIAKNRNKFEFQFSIIILITWALAVIHPLLTIPLFDIHLVNFMMAEQVAPIISLILICSGALFLFNKFKNKKLIMLASLIALLAIGMSNFYEVREGNYVGQWAEYGKTELPPYFVELSEWVRENTNPNDVFLTTNEDGFMLNALTGRKIISYRRAHASPYIDMHQRMADQAVIVYGTNDELRKELLEKYEVKYLLWTESWIFNEFSFDQEGNLVGFFDPLTVPNEPLYKNYWEQNGVQYLEVNMPMDPAPREGVPTYDQLVALPYSISYEPLNPDIYEHFELKKTITYQNYELFKIYEIKD